MKPEIKRAIFKGFFTGVGATIFGISLYLIDRKSVV